MAQEEQKQAFTLKDIEHLLAETNTQLKQVESVLEKENKADQKNAKRISDYKKLQADLTNKKFTLENARDSLLKAEGYREEIMQLNSAPLTKNDMNKICAALFEEDKKWYAARILTVDETNQTAEIFWIGAKEKTILPAKFIKIQKIPEPSELSSGTYCEAIYTEDGRWYPCIIERLVEDGYQIKFKKYGTQIAVPIEYIRTTKDGKAIKRPFEEMTTFKTPDHLKIKPTDTPEQKKQKKKKIKAIKQHLKIKAADKEANERKEGWKMFNMNATERGKGYFSVKKGESIFKSPDTVTGKVGVMGSGKGMTKVTVKPQVPGATDEKKSRLF